MQIENDYDKEVYNGDVGYIDDVARRDRSARRAPSFTTAIGGATGEPPAFYSRVGVAFRIHLSCASRCE